MIEAKIYDENGAQVEGYFWYTDDVDYAVHETLTRCNDENMGWNFIQLVAETGSGEELIVAEVDANGEPTIFQDFA